MHNKIISILKVKFSECCSACYNGLKKKIHWRDLFQIKTLFGLASIYLFLLIYVIIIYFDFSPGFWKQVFLRQNSAVRFSVYSSNGRVGEDLIYYRIRVLAEQNGWQYSGCRFSEKLSAFPLSNFIYNSAASLVNLLFKPKFNLGVTHFVRVFPYGYNLIYLNIPNDVIFSKDGGFGSAWKHLAEADGYVDLHSFVNGSNDVLKQALVKDGQQHKMIYPAYLSVNKNEFVKPSTEILKPVIIGALWGCNRNSLRVGLALKKLANRSLLEGYGHEYALGFLGDAYKGKIESFDPTIPVDEAMEKMYRHYGVSLTIHTLEHYMEGLPTSRAMEAVAAGAIVISDDHPFLKKHFDGTMLFINALTDSEKIYSQISEHITWIQNNKEEAINKARIAHQIFVQHFTLEENMKKIIQEIDAYQKN